MTACYRKMLSVVLTQFCFYIYAFDPCDVDLNKTCSCCVTIVLHVQLN